MRTCNKCGETKQENLFVKQMVKGVPGFRNVCKHCKNVKARKANQDPETYKLRRAQNDAWRKANPEKVLMSKRRAWWAQNGIDPDRAQALVESHDGKCDICKTTDNRGKALAVDHCHATGRIRGIVCDNCNLALALLKDNPNIIQQAYEYLIK